MISVVPFSSNGRRINEPLDPSIKTACIEAAKRLLEVGETEG
jgi:hypothetical protein